MLTVLLYTGTREAPFTIEAPVAAMFTKHPQYDKPVAFMLPEEAARAVKANPDQFALEPFVTLTAFDALVARVEALESQAYAANRGNRAPRAKE